MTKNLYVLQKIGCLFFNKNEVIQTVINKKKIVNQATKSVVKLFVHKDSKNYNKMVI